MDTVQRRSPDTSSDDTLTQLQRTEQDLDQECDVMTQLLQKVSDLETRQAAALERQEVSALNNIRLRLRVTKRAYNMHHACAAALAVRVKECHRRRRRKLHEREE